VHSAEVQQFESGMHRPPHGFSPAEQRGTGGQVRQFRSSELEPFGSSTPPQAARLRQNMNIIERMGPPAVVVAMSAPTMPERAVESA
jgi:hypothetical protein